MDLGTSGIIVGIVAAVVYVVETACKYGSALIKKRILAREKTSHRALSSVGKNIIAMLDPVRQIILADPDSINPANLNRYASCPRQYFKKNINDN